jgi:hypothetical protein
MPQFSWVQSILAGATFEPLTNWQYERMPGNAIIKICDSATAVGLISTVTSGSDTLRDECPVPLYGAAGVLPTDQFVEPLVDEVAAGDKVRIRYRNPTGGAVEVHGYIRF